MKNITKIENHSTFNPDTKNLYLPIINLLRIKLFPIGLMKEPHQMNILETS